MKQIVRFAHVSAEHETVVLEDDPAATVVVPNIGEKVGVWKHDPDSNSYIYHRVADIRHILYLDHNGRRNGIFWVQEIHVLLENI